MPKNSNSSTAPPPLAELLLAGPADSIPPATWCYQRQHRMSQQPMRCMSGTAGGADKACAANDGPVLQVATAMLRRVLAHRPSQLCLFLETEQDGGDVSLRCVYPSSAGWASCYPARAAADLALIDALATRWGHCGNQEWHMSWAVLAGDPDERNRDETPA
jgi:hypothetical protein